MWYVIYHFNMHFSFYVFFLMTYHLLFILYLFWVMEIMLHKKEIPAIFLFEFKIGCNVVETPPTSTTHFAQELLMNIQCSGGSRSFAKETGAWKMKSVVARHQ